MIRYAALRCSLPLLLWLAALTSQLNAQVGIGTTTPSAFAELDVTSTSRGLLVPRLTTTARNAIFAVASAGDQAANRGLMVYDTDNDSLYTWTGSAWEALNTTGGAGGGGDILDGGNSTGSALTIGTNDNNDLNFEVNGVTAYTIRPENLGNNTHIANPNFNTVTTNVRSATIAGGGISGNINRVTDDFSTVGGGIGNIAGNNGGSLADASNATVAGGNQNTASGASSTVGGGIRNSANSTGGTVAGGDDNDIATTSLYATISGGQLNKNNTNGDNAVIAGGRNNVIAGSGAVISGGGFHTNSGVYAVIGGGFDNTNAQDTSFIGGGGTNSIAAGAGFGSSIGGGSLNSIAGSGTYATIAGGRGNSADRRGSSIGGGEQNSVSQIFATVSGGAGNDASGTYSVISGGQDNAATGNWSQVSAGQDDSATGRWSYVAGGINNTANADWSGVLMGRANNTFGDFSAIVGGENNVTGNDRSVVVGGIDNAARADNSVTIGGQEIRTDAFGETNIGLFGEDLSGISDATTPVATDVLFRVSNGTGSFARSTALSIRKDGRVGIGLPSATLGSSLLDLGAADGTRASLRIRPSFAVPSSPNTGDIIYNSSTDELELWTGASWEVLNATGGGTGDILDGGNSTGAAVTIGTNDNFSLFLETNSVNAVEIRPNATSASFIVNPNINVVDAGVSGAAVGGGGESGDANRATDNFGTISGGTRNQVGNNNANPSDRPFATVGGGSENVAAGAYSTIGGGFDNVANATNATVGGGEGNTALGLTTTVAGGNLNAADQDSSFIGGGGNNTIAAGTGFGSAIVGGSLNQIDGGVAYAFLGGGYGNSLLGSHGVVAGGRDNLVGLGNAYAVIGGGQDNGITKSGSVFADYSGVLSGQNNSVEASSLDASFSVITGGGNNFIQDASYASVSGGDGNDIRSDSSFIGGGRNNRIFAGTGVSSVIAGGTDHRVAGSASHSAIGGGLLNTASGQASTIPGGVGLRTNSYAEAAFGAWNLTNPANSATLIDSRDVAMSYGIGSDNATRANALTLMKDGRLGLGLGTALPDAFVDVAPADGTRASLRIRPSFATPSSPNTGDIIYNSSTDELELWTGASWEVLNATGGGTGDILDGGNSTGAAVTIGTNDNFSLFLETNSVNAVEIRPNATSASFIVNPNINTVTVGVSAGTISGGGLSGFANRVTDNGGTIGGGIRNQAGDDAGTVGDRQYATVAGGANNRASGSISTIGGGESNIASGVASFIGGGFDNTAAQDSSFIGGGGNNSITAGTGFGSAIVGGSLNLVDGGAEYAFLGGGYGNTNENNHSVLVGGQGNTNEGQAGVIVGGDNNENVGDYSVVVGGNTNVSNANYTFIGNGQNNQANADRVFIGNGIDNLIGGTHSVAVNGINHQTLLDSSFIGSGGHHSILGSGHSNVIVGGGLNTMNGAANRYNSLVGGYNNAMNGGTNAFLGGGLNNSLSGASATLAGGENNDATGAHAFLGGGLGNATNDVGAVVVGGEANSALNTYSTVVGGRSNTAAGSYTFVGSGENNTADGLNSFIGGGGANEIATDSSVIVGGADNLIAAGTGYGSAIVGGSLNQIDGAVEYGSIGGGYGNRVEGDYAIVSGGRGNLALGDYSFAAGRQAEARAYGEVALGYFPVLAVGDPNNPDPGDLLFGIGNGASTAARSNAITILKNSNTGIGLGNLLPGALLDLDAADANRASLRIRPGIQPTTPNTGDIIYNSGTDVVEFYDGANWVSTAGGGSGPWLEDADTVYVPLAKAVTIGSDSGLAQLSVDSRGGTFQLGQYIRKTDGVNPALTLPFVNVGNLGSVVQVTDNTASSSTAGLATTTEQFGAGEATGAVIQTYGRGIGSGATGIELQTEAPDLVRGLNSNATSFNDDAIGLEAAADAVNGTATALTVAATGQTVTGAEIQAFADGATPNTGASIDVFNNVAGGSNSGLNTLVSASGIGTLNTGALIAVEGTDAINTGIEVLMNSVPGLANTGIRLTVPDGLSNFALEVPNGSAWIRDSVQIGDGIVLPGLREATLEVGGNAYFYDDITNGRTVDIDNVAGSFAFSPPNGRVGQRIAAGGSGVGSEQIFGQVIQVEGASSVVLGQRIQVLGGTSTDIGTSYSFSSGTAGAGVAIDMSVGGNADVTGMFMELDGDAANTGLDVNDLGSGTSATGVRSNVASGFDFLAGDFQGKVNIDDSLSIGAGVANQTEAAVYLGGRTFKQEINSNVAPAHWVVNNPAGNSAISISGRTGYLGEVDLGTAADFGYGIRTRVDGGTATGAAPYGGYFEAVGDANVTRGVSARTTGTGNFNYAVEAFATNAASRNYSFFGGNGELYNQDALKLGLNSNIISAGLHIDGNSGSPGAAQATGLFQQFSTTLNTPQFAVRQTDNTFLAAASGSSAIFAEMDRDDASSKVAYRALVTGTAGTGTGLDGSVNVSGTGENRGISMVVQNGGDNIGGFFQSVGGTGGQNTGVFARAIMNNINVGADIRANSATGTPTQNYGLQVEVNGGSSINRGIQLNVTGNNAYAIYSLNGENYFADQAFFGSTTAISNVNLQARFGSGTDDGILIGSAEELTDGGSNLLISSASIQPTIDNLRNLGSSGFRWNDIFATNTTIQTSDSTLKRAITNLTTGLDAVLQLRPVTYRWKPETLHGRPDDEVHIGFVAQELQQVVPNVVHDHYFEETAEGSGEYVRKEAQTLGVRYSELIPVLTKAIQEQQAQIEALQQEVEALRQQLGNE